MSSAYMIVGIMHGETLERDGCQLNEVWQLLLAVRCGTVCQLWFSGQVTLNTVSHIGSVTAL